MTQHNPRNRPVRALTAAGLCLALLGVLVLQSFGPFDWLGAPKVAAVGGYDAVNVLGPDNFTGAGTWETVFFPVDTVSEFAYDTAGEVIWAVTSGNIYYCATSSACDEEADWTTYSLSSSLRSIVFEPSTNFLYVGRSTGGSPGEILRCDVSDCDDSGDWSSVFLADVDPTIGVGGPVSALAVGDGVIFAGIEHFFNQTSVFRCDIVVDGCDDTGDWVDISPGSPSGGRIRTFYVDDTDGLLFAGYFDSDDSGYILRCDLSGGCDGTDWVTALFTDGPTEAFTLDTDSGILYAGTQTGNAESPPDRPAKIFACDVATSGGCDEDADWTSVYGGFDGAEETFALLWEPTDGVIYALGSGLLRCDVSDTGCDATVDWVSVTPPSGEALVLDPVGSVIHAGGGTMYRCEVSTGCGNANELDQTDGVAYDQAGQRFFVSDFNRHRVLVYDLSDGLDDGEEPVNVLGQTDFTGVDCNDGNGPGDPLDYTLCTPQGLAYDGTNDRLFVNDYNNNRTMVFDLSGPVTNGMPASFVLGQPDFFTTDCETDQMSLCGVQNGVVYDNDGVNERLFVADISNERVMVFDVDPGTISNGELAINVIGKPDFTTSPGSCPVGQATTCFPFGLALNGDDQVLFVSDSSAHRVTTFNVDTATLVPNDAGSDGPDAINVLGQDDFTSVGCDTSATGMCNPTGMSYDSAGNRLFVSEQSNNRVTQFDTTSITDGEAAVDVYGQDDLDSAVADTTQSSLNIARDVVYMSDLDYIAISDSENHRIMFFEAQPNGGGGGGGGPTGGHEATDVVGQLMGDDTPTFDHSGVDNSPNSRGFSGPEGVTIDPVHHRLFEVDPGNHRVMVFDLDLDNQLVDRIADHVLGQTDFRANGNGTDQAKMTYPLYPAYDPDNDRLFVTDYSNNRVMVFDVATIDDGENAINVLGQPDFDTTSVVLSDTGMSNPRGVAYDPTTSRLFVGSQDHQRILVYDVDESVLVPNDSGSNGPAAINVIGQPDFATSGPNLSRDGIGAGNNITIDSFGQRLFLDDSPFSRVMVYDIDESVLVPDDPGSNGPDAINVIGQEDFSSGGSDLDADSLDFSGLYGNGLAYDPDNKRLFVADGSNRRIMVFDADPAVLIPDDSGSNGPDAINVLGQPNFFSEDDSLSQSSTRAAGGLAYDADNGLLYTTTKGDTGQPDPDNRSSIFDVNPGTIVNGEPAVDLLGQLDENDEPFYTARGVDNRPNAQGFDQPTGVVIDPVGHHLFAADYDNGRVLVFDLDENDVLVDRSADFVLGKEDFKGTNGGDQDKLTSPEGLAFDAANRLLFVAEVGGNRVTVWDVATITNGEDAIHVLGQADFTAGSCALDEFTLCGPSAVAYDSIHQRLFVADQDFSHDRVMVFDLSDGTDDGEAATNVLGQETFFASVLATTQDGMNIPFAVGYDPNNDRLFVGENENHRILVFDTAAILDGEDAVNVLGVDDFTTIGGTSPDQGSVDNPESISYDAERDRIYVADRTFHRVMVFDVATITDGEDAIDAYGQETFDTADSGTSRTNLNGPEQVFYDTGTRTVYVGDTQNNRVLTFGPSGGGGGGPQPTPEPIGFRPGRIIINRDDPETDSRNVLVSVYAETTNNFTGIVDVLLSNSTDFSTFVPFRYVIPEIRPNGNANRDIWPKTIAWDLCFGLTDTSSCSLGNKIVYARFYVNVPAPSPVLVRPNEGNMVSSY